MKARLTPRTVAIGLTALVLAAAGLDLAFPPPMGRIDHASVVVLDRRGVWLGAAPAEAGRWRLRADLAHVDPVFVRRLLALEDERFGLHPGVDPTALVRAALSDLTAGRIRSGGSTLAMQLARRLDPHPRTLGAKLIEAVRAVQLRERLGDAGVLADYLTLAPYGGNLEGVRAASLAYFGHEPDRLTDAEQALLIALPQAPEARRPDRHPAAALAARRQVLARLAARGLITPAALALANADPLPQRRSLPNLAWQAVHELAQTAPAQDGTIVSTLDAGLQTDLGAAAARTAAAQGPNSSAAIVVVDVRSRAVRAVVGSVGLDRPGGWIDLTRSLRSPGSALKPFIYAMAFEEGLAAPGSRIRDAPVIYAGYQPRDFDRSYRGEVSVREALRDSLNAPAVSLLAGVGASAFEARLRSASVALRLPATGLSAPGLALALGGEGVRLRDVAMLFAALADGGLAKPLAWTKQEAAQTPRLAGVRLFQADVASQVLDILREGAPPDGRAAIQSGPDADRIAFKTGTSYAFHDAVAAGVRGDYAVVVWTGRPDGGARPGMSGRAAALPLLFDVFDRLRKAAIQPADDAAAVGAPPSGLTDAQGAQVGPQVIFPPDGAVLHSAAGAARGFVLSGQGEGLRWYVDGAPILADPQTHQTLWKPAGPGFFRVQVVDGDGLGATVQVRVAN